MLVESGGRTTAVARLDATLTILDTTPGKVTDGIGRGTESVGKTGGIERLIFRILHSLG